MLPCLRQLSLTATANCSSPSLEGMFMNLDAVEVQKGANYTLARLFLFSYKSF